MKKGLPLIAVTILLTSSFWPQERSNDAIEAWSKITPVEDSEVFEQIQRYRDKGEFDKAVSVVIDQEKNGRRLDDFLLQSVADTYFQWAQVDQQHHSQWVAFAVKYSERALDANKNDPVNVFNVAESYLAAGMNSPKPLNCEYYKKSRQMFLRLKTDPVLKNDWGVIEGERVRIEPYRQKLNQHFENLQLLAAKCRDLQNE